MGLLKDWFGQIIADEPRNVCPVCGRVDAHSEGCLATPKPLPLPRLRLAAFGRAPGREEWTQWRENPVTEFVMAALKRNADEHSDQWHDISWNGGEADQRTLDNLRQRADVLRGIAEADYEAFCVTLGLEPEAPQDAA